MKNPRGIIFFTAKTSRLNLISAFQAFKPQSSLLKSATAVARSENKESLKPLVCYPVLESAFISRGSEPIAVSAACSSAAENYHPCKCIQT